MRLWWSGDVHSVEIARDGLEMIEWRISGENSLLVYENGKLVAEFENNEYGVDFGAMETDEVEEFLDDYFGAFEYKKLFP